MRHLLTIFICTAIFTVRLKAQKTKRIQEEPQSISHIKNFIKSSEEKNDIHEKYELRYAQIYYLKNEEHAPLQKVESMLKQLVQETQNNNLIDIRLKAERILADIYWLDWHDYEKGLFYFMQIAKDLETIPDKDFPSKSEYYINLADKYYYFTDYQGAIYFAKKSLESLKYTKEYDWNIRQAYNIMGLCYKEMGQLNTAKETFKQLLVNDSAKITEQWEGIIKGNIGSVLYQEKKYNLAKPLLLRDFVLALKYNDIALSCGSGTLLADIYLENHAFDSTLYYMSIVHRNIHRSGQLYRLRLLFPIMAKYYSATNNYKDAARFIDSTRYAYINYNTLFDKQLISRLRQKEQVANLENIRSANQNKITIYIFTVIILLLVIGAGFFIFFLREKKKTLTLRLKNVKLQEAQNELLLARGKLSDFSKKLIDTNRIVNELQALLDSSPQSCSQLKETILDKSILTEQDWIDFKKQMNLAYNNFVTRLEDHYPTLTPSEIRYLSMQKMKLSKQEIALALGISTDSLRVTWYRIRRKLKLSADEVPDTIVNQF